MFISGLVLNANRLMHELRSAGKQIAELNLEREQLDDLKKPTHTVTAKVEELYKLVDVVAQNGPKKFNMSTPRKNNSTPSLTTFRRAPRTCQCY